MCNIPEYIMELNLVLISFRLVMCDDYFHESLSCIVSFLRSDFFFFLATHVIESMVVSVCI